MDPDQFYLENRFENYSAQLPLEELRRQRQLCRSILHEKRVERFRQAITQCPEFPAQHTDLATDIIELGRADELSEPQRGQLLEALKAFIPWKKGPFSIFGHDIDAEWRSDLKWQRIVPHKEPLAGRRVADIGCNNGYYMLRMAAENPELVVGFEPYARNYYNFCLLQSIAQAPNLAFELLGVESIDLFPSFFDSVYCLGILYHHTDPVGILRKIHKSLRPGGELIVDCQGIAGDDAVAFIPPGRYARARGIWFLPTLSALKNWLHRANFQHLECFYGGALESSEQRTTEWAPMDSLAEFLDPNDSAKTVEGYPAPWRFYVRATRTL